MIKDNERLFLALPFDSKEQKEVLNETFSWHQLGFQKWTHPDDWHITLHFLGNIDARNQAQIKPAVQEAVRGLSPFPLCLERTGYFGQPARPAVLWLGPKQAPAELARLHASTGEQLQRFIGYTPEERPYSPHLTLARKYAGSLPLQPEQLPAIAAYCWEVTEVALYRSRLGHRPMYEILDRIPLN
ncbi:RNA 2',3'-cyclic phosphodiesterase [Paenibacillaceae bacterium]|nr:RNA 2',3'-cyclic phosphodiesterase [Paenibacillaceae bacterium]